MKIALITGANRGIGLEAARQLGQLGYHVVLGARSEKKGTEAVKLLEKQGIKAVYQQLDVSDPKSIAKASKELTNTLPHLDALVNNAAIIHPEEDFNMNSTLGISIDALKQSFETNFFGMIDLTRQLLPLLKKAPMANVVNVSSILGSLALTIDPESPIYHSKAFGYNSTKTAVNAFTIHLATALKGANIAVNSAHPGWVQTDMGGEQAPMAVEDGAKTLVDLATNKDLNFTGHFIHLGKEMPW